MIVDLEEGWGGDEANGEGGILLCMRVDGPAAVPDARCLAGCWLLAGSLGPRLSAWPSKS